MIYLQLFYIFFKVGIFGFGGGYAILPMIYQEVQVFGLLTADDFSNLVALSQVTPGPIAINSATYVGFHSAGLLGAIVATVGVSMPSFLLIMLALYFIDHFRDNVIVANILGGIKPATVGLMGSAFVFMAVTALFDNSDQVDFFNAQSVSESLNVVAVIIFALTYILIKFTRIGAITLTLLGGFLGVVLSLLMC